MKPFKTVTIDGEHEQVHKISVAYGFDAIEYTPIIEGDESFPIYFERAEWEVLNREMMAMFDYIEDKDNE